MKELVGPAEDLVKCGLDEHPNVVDLASPQYLDVSVTPTVAKPDGDTPPEFNWQRTGAGRCFNWVFLASVGQSIIVAMGTKVAVVKSRCLSASSSSVRTNNWVLLGAFGARVYG
jgi:hypothetical protein